MNFIHHLQQVEKFGKQPAILTLKQYLYICTYLITVDKMTVIGEYFRHLLAFKYTLDLTNNHKNSNQKHV